VHKNVRKCLVGGKIKKNFLLTLNYAHRDTSFNYFLRGRGKKTKTKQIRKGGKLRTEILGLLF